MRRQDNGTGREPISDGGVVSASGAGDIVTAENGKPLFSSRNYGFITVENNYYYA